MRPSKNNLRYSKQTKKKKLDRSSICKKQKSKRKWYTVHKTSNADLAPNEEVGPKKLEHVEETKHWKVMPKDSCEVYRARRKRQQMEMSNRASENIEKNPIEE